MNKLDQKTRAKILHLVCEGNSIRAVTRLTGASKTTVTKLIVDAGTAASWYQDRVFQNLTCRRLQLDEIWSFTHCKQANVMTARSAPPKAGDAWLWVATDADTKLVPSWYLGARDSSAGFVFLDDLKSRLASRVQLTSDGHGAYLEAMDCSFGNDVDYAMLVKIYGKSSEGQHRYSPAKCLGARKGRVRGKPDPAHISTSFAERNNLNIRMHSRRFTRLTNGFSKKFENHMHAMALHFLYYNFVRIHQTLKTSPAMAAGITNRLWEMKDVVDMIEAWEARDRQEEFLHIS
jgi:IS1 family transposase